MSKLGDLYKDEEWLKIMYIEAWKQYSHEDDLGQSRMTIFLAVHAALIAIVGAVAKPLADIEPLIINSHEFHIGLCITSPAQSFKPIVRKSTLMNFISACAS